MFFLGDPFERSDIGEDAELFELLALNGNWEKDPKTDRVSRWGKSELQQGCHIS